MRDAWIRAAAVVASTRELYRKLSTSQRVALIVVAGVVMTSLVIVARVVAGSQPYSEGAAVDSGGGAGGSKSRRVAGRAPAEPAERSGGFLGFETADSKEWRRLQANRVMLELALAGRNVEEARILYSPAKPAHYVFGKTSEASAAVMLYLSRDVDRLERQKADGLRDMVVHSLNVQPERVFLRDDQGNTYPASGSQAEHQNFYEGEKALRGAIRNQIMEYYSRLYGPSEYFVTVTVCFSMEQTTIDTTTFDPAGKVRITQRDKVVREDVVDKPAVGGLGASKKEDATVRKSVSSEFEEENAVGSTRTKTSLPRGVPSSVSANILVDLEAVLRNQALEQEPDLAWDGLRSGTGDAEWLLATYRRSQEEAVLNMLRPYPDSSVTVEFQPFVKAESIVPHVSLAGTVVPPGREMADFPPWLLFTMLGTGVAVVGIFLVRGRARRKWRAPADFSPAAVSGLGLAAGLSVGEALSGATASGKMPSLRDGFPDGILRTVDDTSSRVKERPEVAAAVLRFWLRQDRKETQVGASRS